MELNSIKINNVVINFLCRVGLENIDVVDLEGAKYLKSIGYNNPSYWYWLDKDLSFVTKGLKRVKYNRRKMNHNKYNDFIYSAPSKEDLIIYINNLKIK